MCVPMLVTTHVETVVLLSHKKPDGHINVKVEFGEGEGKVPLDNIAKRAESYKPKERVTYKMVKEYIEVKYGFKVHTAYIAEVKRKCGIEVGKNLRVATRRMDCLQGNSTTAATDLELVPSPNLPKNEDSRQPQCPEDKESAIVEALKHFKMNS